MRFRELKDGDEIDLITWQEYGDLPGALEAVLRANWDILRYFDNIGQIHFDKGPDGKPIQIRLSIALPDLPRPTETTKTVRIFD